MKSDAEAGRSGVLPTPTEARGVRSRGEGEGVRTMSVVELANALLRHRRLMVMTPLVLGFMVGLTLLLLPPKFTATASFTPQGSEGGQARLSGLAAQFGFPLGAAAAGQSPDFYAQLLSSRQILRQMVMTEYDVAMERRAWLLRKAPENVTGNLIELFEIREASEEKGREKAVEKLRGQMAVGVSLETGIVGLRVTTGSPALSLALVNRAIELVEEFNLDTRQSQAAAERRFIEGRLDETRRELEEAESALQDFLQRNRAFENSPQLTFEHERLQRAIAVPQQLFISLAQAHEQARIDEVRNTPIITLIEDPVLPPSRDRRGTVLKTLLALMIGFVLAGVIALLREQLRSGKEHPSAELDEFDTLASAALSDVRRVLRRVRRPFSSSSRAAL